MELYYSGQKFNVIFASRVWNQHKVDIVSIMIH